MSLYQLKGGEEWRDGILYGWTGSKCITCKGHGLHCPPNAMQEIRCDECGGTGEEWGRMPEQPAQFHLPPARLQHALKDWGKQP